MRFFASTLLFTIVFLLTAGGVFAQTLTPTERRAQLQEELKKLEAEMEGQKGVIDEKKKQAQTLQRDIGILDASIKKTDSAIRAKDIEIGRIGDEISERQISINALAAKIERSKKSLAQLVRRTSEINDTTLAEVILSNKGLSGFFVDLDSFDVIKAELRDSFDELRTTKEQTEEEKKALEEKQDEAEVLRKAQALEKQKLAKNKTEKNTILKETKGQEKAYQQLLSERQKDAARIRAELFTLAGSAAIPFERALDIAKRAGAKTGVRPAFILGIIAVESNLGQNVGKGNWKVDMHPTRDQPIFKEITAELGLNPDDMPVSKKVWYGYGGAMGPAQFIPSTWVLFKSKVAAITGNNPPNPWNPEDAFHASALLLKDNGAAKQTYAAEFRSAMCYLAGCGNANKASLQFYGEDVMELAAKYQKQIDILGG